MTKQSGLFACSCAAIAVICALSLLLNAALPGPVNRGAASGGEAPYAYAFTAQDTDDAGLFVKGRSGQALYLNGEMIKAAGQANVEPVALQAGNAYVLTADTPQAPAISLGSYSRMLGLWSAAKGLHIAIAAAFAVMLVYTLSLYMGKRSERYLLSLAGYLLVMLAWVALISMRERSRFVAAVEQAGFTVLSLLSVRLCQMLTRPKLPRALCWVESRRYFVYALAVTALIQLVFPALRYAVSFALFVTSVYVLCCAAAQGKRNAGMLLAAMVLLTGLRPSLMIFSRDPAYLYESVIFTIFRTRTRAHDLILALAAMLYVNQEFAWQFAEKERLAAHLDELVRARTQKLTDMQEQRQSMMLNIFHDVRAPLAVMRGALDAIEANPEAAGAMLPLISSRLRFVTELTGDLFLAAKLEDGQVMLTCARVDLSAVAQEQGEQAGQLAREAGVRLTVSVEPGLTIWGERLRMGQIAQNLLTNAVHYTPAGGEVRLSLAREGEMAVLRVADSGKGISPEDQKHIFDRYFHTTAASKHESSGLGLTIARELTVLHRGTLAVESEVGSGTAFIARFPLLEEENG